MPSDAPPTGLRAYHAEVPWQGPIDAYRRLVMHHPLLLDGNGAHPEARYAVLALSPHHEGRMDGHRLTIRPGTWTHPTGPDEVREGDPLRLLRAWTDGFRFPRPDVGPAASVPFTGGFVGVVGYAFTLAVEPTLPAPHGDGPTPDMVLRLCRDALVFDRKDRVAHLWTHDLPGESGADARLQTLLDDLARPAATVPPIVPTDLAWEPSMDEATFCAAVEDLREKIRTGDLFQANLATRFRAPLDADPADLFAAFQAHNASPFMALMDFGDHAIVSNSPEQLLAVQDGRIRSRPIAGTRPRGTDGAEDQALEQELLTDDKERAEHTMLVDLVRNDIAKVAVPGTVRVPEAFSVERYRRVMHLVSRVEGQVRPDTGFTDWLAALFPGGTITGAPKHRACQRIHETEPVPRGPYTGSAGFLAWDHATHWNILIRTLVLRDGLAHVHAGSGIVMDSVPAREWREAGHKARALLEAVAGAVEEAGPPGRLGEVTTHGSWDPPTPTAQVKARVLVIDNYDSFTHNLAEYASALGADVAVLRNDEDWAGAIAAWRPTHIILSPGPGRPDDARASLEIAKNLVGHLPILGVCLGHQCLALAAGADVVVAGEAVHGKTAQVRSEGSALLPSRFEATRYHSLIVDPKTLPPSWKSTAWLADGTLMAMEHESGRAFGLQFHPESFRTEGGLEILLRFLQTG